MLDYRMLHALLAIENEGSFEKAAQTLHITPSAVSQRIKALENQVGGRVVIRGKTCEITPLGHRLADHTRKVLMLENDVIGLFPAEGGPEQLSVKIAVNADSLATWFVSALADTAKKSTSILFRLLIEDQQHSYKLLKTSEVIAAVSEEEINLPGFSSVFLGELEYCAVATPRFCEQHMTDGLTREAAADMPFLRYSNKDMLQNHWLDEVVGHGLQPPNHIIPSSHDFVRATEAELGWSMNPLPLVSKHLDTGQLRELVPGRRYRTPLYWHYSSLMSGVLDELTASVRATARASLCRDNIVSLRAPTS